MARIDRESESGLDQAIEWPESRRGHSLGLSYPSHHLEDHDEVLIDQNLVQMIESLPPGHDFASRIDSFCEESEQKLSALKLAINAENKAFLEDLCNEISQQAITVGAARVLRLSYETQAAGRAKNFAEARHLMSDLEAAVKATQNQLRELI